MKRKDYIKTAVITIIIMAASIISLYLGTAGAWDARISDWLNQKEAVTNKKIYINLCLQTISFILRKWY